MQGQLFRQMCQYYLSLLRILGILHMTNSKIGSSALESKRPCSREAFRALPFGHRFFLWLFEKTRLPLRPCFGGFPVKLRTHIGKLNSGSGNSRISHFSLISGEPIYPEPGMTPEQLRDRCQETTFTNRKDIIQWNQALPWFLFRCRESLTRMIEEHQRLPGSIFRCI